MHYGDAMPTARARLLILAAAGILALTACTPQPETTPTPDATPSSTATATPTPTPTPTPTADAVDYPTVDTISCETMLDPAVDAQLRAKGYIPAGKQWSQFSHTATLAAIECPWAEPGGTFSEAYYAWAALAPGEAEVFIGQTLESGYVTEEAAEGTWVVWGKDDGMPTPAILVTDEWVAMADTQEQVADIVWAR